MTLNQMVPTEEKQFFLQYKKHVYTMAVLLWLSSCFCQSFIFFHCMKFHFSKASRNFVIKFSKEKIIMYL